MPESSPDTTPIPPLRIVVIDDDDGVANALVDLFRVQGHTAHAAFDGLTGIDLVRQHRAQVLFLDVAMPVMDGFTVARYLREGKLAEPSLYLVALTGYGHPSDVQAILSAGFDFHLTKPADIEAIEGCLRRAVRVGH